MQYVGIQTQQSRNNLRSGILLILFPCLVAVLTYLFCYLLITFTVEDDYGQYNTLAMTNQMFINLIPYIIGGVLVWFIIAYFTNSSIIKAATGARPLERKENKRIYNLVENLCMSQGMKMPKINIIDDDSLNAYASGINEQTYTVTLSKGIIEKLNDEELEGVIAHELTHIRNHDVRLLIISIVFVGIFSMLAQIALRSVYYSSWTRSRNDKNNGAILILVFHPALARTILVLGLKIVEKLHLMKRKESRLKKLEASMEVYQNTAAYLGTHKMVLVNVLAITFAQRFALFAATWFVYRAFHLSGISFIAIVLLQAVISVSVDMLPLPGGMGISETLFLKIFPPVFGSTLLLPAMVLSRGLGYYGELLVSAVFTIVAQLTIGNTKREKRGGTTYDRVL